MVARNNFCFVTDPLKLKNILWPHVTFYKQQKDIIYSVWEDDETISVAGNMLGKDYVAGFIILAFFLTRLPCRVMTTSVDATQLEGVLWGEIRRFIQESKYPLSSEEGGPLLINHLNIRRIFTSGPKRAQLCPISYIKGRTVAKGEGMLGHHVSPTAEQMNDGIPRTLFVADEASGVDDKSYENADTWAHRKLIIGNPYPCSNFFYKGVKKGNIPRKTRPKYFLPEPENKNGTPDETKQKAPYGFHRRVIKIRAQDSPNVRFAEAEREAGIEPSNTVIIPGVLSWDKYVQRRAMWDEMRQQIGLDAEFWEGKETKLYPIPWITRAERYHQWLEMMMRPRRARSMGIDPAEGGNSTVWAIGDEWGLLKLISLKTPDTSVIPGRTLALMNEWGIPPEMVVFDRADGKQYADIMRESGYNVRSVGFGEGVSAEPAPDGSVISAGSMLDKEARYLYKNRRCQMYGEFALLMDPIRETIAKGIEGEEIDDLMEQARKLRGESARPTGFAIPLDPEFDELKRQMTLIPKLYNKEGELRLPPKRKLTNKNTGEPDLMTILGCSPDELDAVVLMVHAQLHQSDEIIVGAYGG